MMWEPTIWLIVLEWCLRLGFAVRVIMRGGPIGYSLAWLSVILLVPVVGVIVYFLLSETRLGFRREALAARLREQSAPWHQRLWDHEYRGWETMTGDPAQLSRLIAKAAMNPPLGGNELQLLESANDVFATMIADIQGAKESCYLEYYIWETGGIADELAQALGTAAERGVDCRVLVDAVGSRGFLRSQTAKRLKDQGVQIRGALPATLFRSLFNRFDLRLHRKIALIDHQVGYVGSQNIADPQLFNEGAGFGQWIDAMVRLQGPAVGALWLTFWEDWHLESLEEDWPEKLPQLDVVPEPMGAAPVQVIPSGPGVQNETIREILLNAIYMADTHLSLTTPYFVPDETLLTAIKSAVRRGVKVTIILPQKVNSILIRLANRAFIRELVQLGVEVTRYQAGMLHTKSIVIDNDTCMFGSLNLDPRSLHLNFEITLAIYDKNFTRTLYQLQQQYLMKSSRVTSEELAEGSWPQRFIENCARLLAPLL